MTGSSRPIRYPRTMMLTTRRYDAARDGDMAFELYGSVLGDLWPLESQAFRQRARNGLVACQDGAPVGVALLGSEGGERNLQMLLVAPDCRRAGVGSLLHRAAVTELQREGAGSVRL